MSKQSPEAQLKPWAAQRIAAILQMPTDSCGEIVDNILVYDDADELKGFLRDFAEKSAEQQVISFVEELFARRSGTQRGRGNQEPVARGAGQAAATSAPAPASASASASSAGRRAREEASKPCAAGKDKENFPKLDMPVRPRKEGDRRLMVIDAASGRHNVLTNCLNCGKVVVEEEGWGPCLFCGNPLEVGDKFGVRHGDDRGFLEPVGQPNDEEEKYNASFERAKATKDRLLSYDRDAQRRTKVFDDATDWYAESVNPWLNARQREEAIRKGNEEERRRREEKRRIHAKIDIFGRTVISADAEVEEEMVKKDREAFQEWSENAVDRSKFLSMFEEGQRGLGGANSQLSEDSRQLYDKLRASLHAVGKDLQQGTTWGGQRGGSASSGQKKNTRWDASIDSGRVEDEFSALSVNDFVKASGPAARLLPVEESPYGNEDDSGQCLSMHQPWASLLVYGFKRAEGRGWKTEHRGRLWIHAAAKPPDDFEIESLEQRYRSIYEARGVPIPALPSESGGYPTSALIGCVDLEECWTQAEYTNVLAANPSMPQEENDCEYIFWCLRPRRLLVPLKMGGDHKIWRLPKTSLVSAQNGLHPVRWPAPGDGESAMSSPPLDRPAQSSGSAAPSRSAAAAAAAASAASGSATSARSGSKASEAPKLPRFDLWPLELPKEKLEVAERDRDSADRDVVVLQNGFVHLIGFIPGDVQQRIIDIIREAGISDRGFVAEQFDGVKVSKEVMRMYLGSHWNSVTQRWEQSRGNLDRQPVLELPQLFAQIYREAVSRANREFKTPQSKKRKLAPFPEGRPPTLGVANFYPVTSSMQLHQDKTESQESIAAGYPVMGICIGDACEFAYSTEAPGTSGKPKVLRMESGDVYLFGGESRLLWHGVTRIMPRTGPPSLRLVPGRLSVTLRVN